MNDKENAGNDAAADEIRPGSALVVCKHFMADIATRLLNTMVVSGDGRQGGQKPAFGRTLASKF